MLGADYGLAGQKGSESTRWIALSARRAVVPPHSSRDVEVGLLVPRSAKPGEYLSGVAIQGAGRRTGGLSGSRHQDRGELPLRRRRRDQAARPTPARYPPHGVQLTRYPASVVFLLLASNTGNVILKNVHGSVLITQGGRRVIAKKIEPGTFVSHTSIKLPVLTPHEHPSAAPSIACGPSSSTRAASPACTNA